MIVSRGRGYIFVHIPKTGGTALALALEERAMKDDILIGDTPKARRRRGRLAGVKTSGRLWKHSTLAEAEGLITPDDLDRLRIVTLIRNPWDRAVSYYHWLRGQRFDNPAVTLAKGVDFTTFLNDPRTRAGFRDWPARRFVTDGAGRLRDCDIIRLERFGEDSAGFAAHLGFPLVLPRANASPRARDWRIYYSDADADLIARLCAEDIALGRYTFDPD